MQDVSIQGGSWCSDGVSPTIWLFFPRGCLKIVQISSCRTHLNFPVNRSMVWVLVRMEGVWKRLEDQSSTTPIRVDREQAAKILQNAFKLSSTFHSLSSLNQLLKCFIECVPLSFLWKKKEAWRNCGLRLAARSSALPWLPCRVPPLAALAAGAQLGFVIWLWGKSWCFSTLTQTPSMFWELSLLCCCQTQAPQSRSAVSGLWARAGVCSCCAWHCLLEHIFIRKAPATSPAAPSLSAQELQCPSEPILWQPEQPWIKH